MKKKLKSLLVIAGSDPLGGAGIQCDIRAASSLGLHVMTALTAVTVQNSNAFKEIGAVNQYQLKAQIEIILEDVKPDAIKIGMIGSKDNIVIISGLLKNLKDIPIVIDPVLKASIASDNPTLEKEMIAAYKDFLFPLASVITPNFDEVKRLCGEKNPETIIAKELTGFLNVDSVVITGVNIGKDKIRDILISKNYILKADHSIFECENLHGTGCAFSTFLASYLALGNNLKESFERSVRKMNNVISRSCDYQLGNSIYGPLNLSDYSK